MSDRRRYPKPDDWEDDLDLAGFDRPASGASRQPARQYPESGSSPRQGDPFQDDDFPGQSPRYTQSARSSSRRPTSAETSERRRRSDDPYSADSYPPPTERDPYGGQSYDAERYERRRARESPSTSRYGAEFTDEPARPPQRGRRTPAGEWPERGYEAAAYGERGDYADTAYPPAAPSRRRDGRSRESRERSAATMPMPAINDGVVVAVVAAALLSIVFMIGSLAAGTSNLPSVFPIHFDSSGHADIWGNKATLWRIPLGALMGTIMSLVIAAFLWKRDRFAARFAIVGAAVLQIIAWVALVDFIW